MRPAYPHSFSWRPQSIRQSHPWLIRSQTTNQQTIQQISRSSQMHRRPLRRDRPLGACRATAARIWLGRSWAKL